MGADEKCRICDGKERWGYVPCPLCTAPDPAKVAAIDGFTAAQMALTDAQQKLVDVLGRAA